MVKNNLVEIIAEHLKIPGKVFVQTDVDFLAEEMFELFRENAHLCEVEVAENPFPIKTEREIAVEEKGLPIYRAMFEKTKAEARA
ncbi:MAG: tRNA (guanosine(46)-N7)-methyltransferase TrmB, partial [Acidobacteriota bacterium]|nr:tRNA (guanosine(46)-N7)-methyltransferase TrmB [Acidobacteriota bacterium]